MYSDSIFLRRATNFCNFVLIFEGLVHKINWLSLTATLACTLDGVRVEFTFLYLLVSSWILRLAAERAIFYLWAFCLTWSYRSEQSTSQTWQYVDFYFTNLQSGGVCGEFELSKTELSSEIVSSLFPKARVFGFLSLLKEGVERPKTFWPLETKGKTTLTGSKLH